MPNKLSEIVFWLLAITLSAMLAVMWVAAIYQTWEHLDVLFAVVLPCGVMNAA